ncbi:MAG: hypothetical protein E7543_01740 [Ruminococcaceae bacterium]|nr:hypothetical protein [Oscillospiraceae bacterium]
MKKIISVLLSVIMLFGVFSVTVSAEQQEYTDYPVILVPGYISAVLYRTDAETGEKIIVWDDPVAQVSEGGDLASVLPDAKTYLSEGNVEPLAEKLSEGFNRIFAEAKCNPDGTSLYDISTWLDTAEDGNYAALKEKYPDGKHQYEKEMLDAIGEKIGDENVYIYTGDFRMGAIELAEDLHGFIDDVIAHNNSLRAEKGKAPIDRVNLFAVSHGGQVSGAYLALYGHEGKVNNAVLTCPALGGAGIAYDVFNTEVSFDEVGLLTFIQHGFMLDEDLEILLMAQQLGFIDELVEALFPRVAEIIGCWGSLWDFIPPEQYESVKAKLLDEEVHAGLIEKSDRMHYEIMSRDGENSYEKGFKAAQATGTNIYIISGYDNKIITGMEVSSDAILPTAGSTGATVAPLGQRFADGYTQKADTGFYQVSPSMTLDASTSYLPEHTWFVENYYHGMTVKDEFTHSLMEKLLLNDEAYDVNSMAEYPQFHATTNPAHSVWAAFDSSKEGYVSAEDTALVIKNISNERKMIVTAVSVEGADISLDFEPFTLGAGESKEIAIVGEIPEVSLKNFEINISYFFESFTPIGGRTFDFTVMNGEAVAYDESTPYVNADAAFRFDIVFDEDVKDLISKNFVENLLSFIYNTVVKIMSFIMNAFA